MAMAARCTIVEVEEPIVEAGELDPDQIHTPGIYVDRLVQIPADGILREPPATVIRSSAAATPPRQRLPRRPRAHSEQSTARGEPLTRDQIGSARPAHRRGWMREPRRSASRRWSRTSSTPSRRSRFTPRTASSATAGVAGEGEERPGLVNAGGQFGHPQPGGTFVHHADSFALIRRGMATSPCSAPTRWPPTARSRTGARRRAVRQARRHRRRDGPRRVREGVWLAMEHTTRDGQPRLLEHCALPVTAPGRHARGDGPRGRRRPGRAVRPRGARARLHASRRSRR